MSIDIIAYSAQEFYMAPFPAVSSWLVQQQTTFKKKILQTFYFHRFGETFSKQIASEH